MNIYIHTIGFVLKGLLWYLNLKFKKAKINLRGFGGWSYPLPKFKYYILFHVAEQNVFLITGNRLIYFFRSSNTTKVKYTVDNIMLLCLIDHLEKYIYVYIYFLSRICRSL